MDKKRLKIAYVPPQAEVCAAAPYSFVAASLGGDPGSATFGEYFGGGGGSAGAANLSTDAREFSITFTDPWGEGDN